MIKGNDSSLGCYILVEYNDETRSNKKLQYPKIANKHTMIRSFSEVFDFYNQH